MGVMRNHRFASFIKTRNIKNFRIGDISKIVFFPIDNNSFPFNFILFLLSLLLFISRLPWVITRNGLIIKSGARWMAWGCRILNSYNVVSVMVSKLFRNFISSKSFVHRYFEWILVFRVDPWKFVDWLKATFMGVHWDHRFNILFLCILIKSKSMGFVRAQGWVWASVPLNLGFLRP